MSPSHLALPLTLLLLAVFLALAIRAIRTPLSAARGFGIPSPRPETFVRVYGSRNLAIASACGVLLALGDHRAVAVVLTCATPLTLFDLFLVNREGVARAGVRHVVALALLGCAATLWWLS
jgi:hypothetical protein